jgi:hypothetical protein
MKVTETTSLFTDALLTMNAAIEANEDKFPYKLFFDASQKLDVELTMGVAVYKDDPDTPHDYYTICFQQNRLELLSHGKEKGIDIVWKVSEAYLEKLEADPQRYIDNPALMDWDWLKSRLGVK